MKWIKVKDRKPTAEDSPILAINTLDYFSTIALQYIKAWDGWGWYDATKEYGMSLNEGEAWYHKHNWYHEDNVMKYWMRLPELPND